MEDNKKQTNWKAVLNCLDDALDYFEGENSAVDAIHDMIISLMDLVNCFIK